MTLRLVGHALCSDVTDVLSEDRPTRSSRPGRRARAYAVFDEDRDGVHDRFRGLVTAQDIALRPECTFEDILPRDLRPTVTPDMPVHQALELMHASGCDALAVVDAAGRFSGAITYASLARAMLRGGPDPVWLAGVGHDLNNLLTIINSGLDVLHTTLHSNDHHARELCEEMQQALLCAAAYGKHLMDFARGEKHADLNEIVNRAAGAVRLGMAAPLEVVRRLSPDIPAVAIAPVELFQVVFNLLLNARDAMPNGGVLCVSTRFLAGESEVALTVSDSGHGMAPEVLARILELGFTHEKPRGFGIGLTAVHRSVVAAGGTLLAASEPNIGSTFTVSLPVARQG